jgi:hypothetical protein
MSARRRRVSNICQRLMLCFGKKFQMPLLLSALRSTGARTGGFLCGMIVAVGCLLQTTTAQHQIPAFTKPRDAYDLSRRNMEKLLAPARKKLRQKNIPFDPYITIEGDWRKQIDPALWAMPEMKRNLRVTGSMKGIYLADTLLVDEKVRLKGDTILIIRELAPDDENRNLTIRGDGNLFMFFVGDQKKVRARSWRGEIGIETTGKCATMGMSGNGYYIHVKCHETIGISR